MYNHQNTSSVMFYNSDTLVTIRITLSLYSNESSNETKAEQRIMNISLTLTEILLVGIALAYLAKTSQVDI